MTKKLTAGAAVASLVALLAAAPGSAQLDRLLQDAPQLPQMPSVGLSDAKIVSGLKEALQVGTGNAVALAGRTDGYFANQAIKILMPEKLRTLEKGLRTVGYGPQIIGEMSFDDARRILQGTDTAATDYFKGKTTDKLAVSAPG